MAEGSRFVECDEHGESRPAFVCQHLVRGRNLGWHEPEEYSYDPDDEFAGCLNAWCDECEAVREKCDGWNDESESFAGITLLCERCARQAKERNLN